jgi:hypothetical protein
MNLQSSQLIAATRHFLCVRCRTALLAEWKIADNLATTVPTLVLHTRSPRQKQTILNIGSSSLFLSFARRAVSVDKHQPSIGIRRDFKSLLCLLRSLFRNTKPNATSNHHVSVCNTPLTPSFASFVVNADARLLADP